MTGVASPVAYSNPSQTRWLTMFTYTNAPRFKHLLWPPTCNYWVHDGQVARVWHSHPFGPSSVQSGGVVCISHMAQFSTWCVSTLIALKKSMGTMKKIDWLMISWKWNKWNKETTESPSFCGLAPSLNPSPHVFQKTFWWQSDKIDQHYCC